VAAVRFASCEPLLGELEIRRWLADGLEWVIAGGESGPGARPMHPDWARSLRDQCLAAGCRTSSSSGARLLLRLMVTIVAESTSSTAAARAGMGWNTSSS
jgi:hypothetical protein